MILLSTVYFPPISWMALLVQNNGKATIENYETYSKQSFRNRFEIATSHGKMSLSVPVIKPLGNKTKINNIVIDYSENWQQVHWRSIKAAYQSSPFFIHYADDIEAIINQRYTYLYQMNEKIIKKLVVILGLEYQIKSTSDFVTIGTHENDYRFLIHPKKKSMMASKSYDQVFEEKNGFLADLSVLDLIFNLGPEALLYLQDVKIVR